MAIGYLICMVLRLMSKHVVKNENMQQFTKIYFIKIVRIFDTIEIK